MKKRFALQSLVMIIITIPGILAAQPPEITAAPNLVPEIVTLPDMTIVGMQTLVSTKNNIISNLWMRFIPRAGEIKERAKTDAMLGISYDMQEISADPSTRESQFFYLAGAIVSDVKDLPEGMTFRKILKHKYAKFTHRGSLDKLGDTYNYMYGQWLPKSAYDVDEIAPEIEWYDNRFMPDSANSAFDIYMPITAK
ncbi:MAG TPA: GyrI-like domain-containing protein [bacterium]